MSLTGSTSTIRLDDGRKAFRKALPAAPAGFFAFEAAGLQALADLGARVPQVYEVTDEQLVIELIDADASAATVEHPEYAFGKELAALHLAGRRSAAADQSFGSLPGVSHWFLGGAEIDLQPAETLYESLVTNRVVPLTQRAVEARLLQTSALEMAQRIEPEHLGPFEAPVVVHGDLWAGNRIVDASGASWLIDPSAHWGHREQDIAMMRLFGGFGPEVFDAYNDRFPLAHGWQARVPTFQLVPLLVHVILFGQSYASPTMRALHQTLDH